VSNFGNESYGRITLRTALADSVNTVFAQLNIDLANGGTKAVGVRDAAVLAGVPKNTPGLQTNMNNIFGTASPHVIDMANAYATIAAQGKRATPYLIAKVTSADGKNDYTVAKKVSTVFNKKVTADVTDAMERVVTEGTAKKARALGRPAAGKTGTATANKAVWFDGFTPQLAAAVGIYQGNGQDSIKVKGFSEVTGATFSVKIWTAFMEGALKGEKVVPFPARAGLGDSKLPPPPPIPTQAPTPTPTPTPTPSHTTPTHTQGTPQPTRSTPTGQPTRIHPTGPGPGPTVPPTAAPAP
jgi:membrane peptidoglycan carboxypeptidase